MKPFSFIFVLLISFFGCTTKKDHSTPIKVMSWNILHGGNDIENGVQNVIKIVEHLDPDILLMVETYGSGPKIAEALGYNFHLIAQEGTSLDDKRVNLSMFSKYPFGERIDTEYPFYLGGREVYVEGQKLNIFSNWFHYEPWHDQPEKMNMNADEILAWEKTGKKYEMMQKVLPYFKTYASMSDSIPLIIGGDMNTLSHLDWSAETKLLHNDLVVPWYGTKALEDVGLIDSYRALHPDPIASPGITWDTKDKIDEHRIDYIFYKGKKLTPISSLIYMSQFDQPFDIGDTTLHYPSDHGIVVTTFNISASKQP